MKGLGFLMHVVGLSVCSVQRWDFLRDGMVTKVGHTINNNRRGPIKGRLAGNANKPPQFKLTLYYGQGLFLDLTL